MTAPSDASIPAIPSPLLKDMVGQRFGRLLVIERAPCPRTRPQNRRRTFWQCRCDCGNSVVVEATSLRLQSRSCGCGREVSHLSHGQGGRKHGRDQSYSMFHNARQRAKRRGLVFDLTLNDIVIPRYCPVLGLELAGSTAGGPADNSPSLDRIRMAEGYIRGNIEVISFRANRIKHNATVEELEKVLAYMKSNERPAV